MANYLPSSAVADMTHLCKLLIIHRKGTVIDILTQMRDLFQDENNTLLVSQKEENVRIMRRIGTLPVLHELISGSSSDEKKELSLELMTCFFKYNNADDFEFALTDERFMDLLLTNLANPRTTENAIYHTVCSLANVCVGVDLMRFSLYQKDMLQTMIKLNKFSSHITNTITWFWARLSVHAGEFPNNPQLYIDLVALAIKFLQFNFTNPTDKQEGYLNTMKFIKNLRSFNDRAAAAINNSHTLVEALMPHVARLGTHMAVAVDAIRLLPKLRIEAESLHSLLWTMFGHLLQCNESVHWAVMETITEFFNLDPPMSDPNLELVANHDIIPCIVTLLATSTKIAFTSSATLFLMYCMKYLPDHRFAQLMELGFAARLSQLMVNPETEEITKTWALKGLIYCSSKYPDHVHLSSQIDWDFIRRCSETNCALHVDASYIRLLMSK